MLYARERERERERFDAKRVTISGFQTTCKLKTEGWIRKKSRKQFQWNKEKQANRIKTYALSAIIKCIFYFQRITFSTRHFKNKNLFAIIFYRFHKSQTTEFWFVYERRFVYRLHFYISWKHNMTFKNAELRTNHWYG